MSARNTLDSLLARCIPEPNTGCWLWLGSLSDGYGHASYGGKKSLPAHRVIWTLMRGPIPEGMQLDHIRCRTRCCVNPDHLRVVTLVQNVLENSFCNAALNAAKPNCPRCGGAYRNHKNGDGRYCPRCKNENRDREYMKTYLKAYRERQRSA